MRLLVFVQKRWLRIESSPRRLGILAGLVIGFIAGFGLSRDLKTGLLVSFGLVGSNAVAVLVNHFVPKQKRGR